MGAEKTAAYRCTVSVLYYYYLDCRLMIMVCVETVSIAEL